ncbi:MAG: serine protease [Fibrobacter sp.]|nr:serine protease [Fibrobacter sp.]
MKNKLLLIIVLFCSLVYAEKFEFVYSGYILQYYNKETKTNGYGSERDFQEVGTIAIDLELDSSMTIHVMNKFLDLKMSSFYGTENSEGDSVAFIRSFDKNDKQEYVLVIGPGYVNLAKIDRWKLSFDIPQKFNQERQSDGAGERESNIVTGSSFAITKHELITNNHVVKGKKFIFVNKNPETKKGYVKAYVLYRDPDLDLAVLRTDSNLTSCAMDRSVYDIGEDIYVYGYPQIEKQGTSLKLTKGVISSKRGFHDDVKTYQIDAAVQPGNSGGPLVRNGKIIGVTSAQLTDSQNVNYAIKSNFVGAIIDVLGIKNVGKADPKNCTYFVVGRDD